MYGYQIITVGSGAAVSNWIDLRDYGLGGLVTPAALDTNSHVAFMVTNDPVNNPGGFPLYDEGTGSLVEVPVAINAARAYQFPVNVFTWPWVKIWLENAGADVAQAADRRFIVFSKSVN